jgi:hypothetical protein
MVEPTKETLRRVRADEQPRTALLNPIPAKLLQFYDYLRLKWLTALSPNDRGKGRQTSGKLMMDDRLVKEGGNRATGDDK